MLVLTNVPQTFIKLGQRISGLTGCFHFQLLALYSNFAVYSQSDVKIRKSTEVYVSCLSVAIFVYYTEARFQRITMEK